MWWAATFLMCWWVLGISSLVKAEGLMITNTLLLFDIPLLVIISVLFIPLYISGRIPQWLGLITLLCYCAYTWLLFKIPHSTLSPAMSVTIAVSVVAILSLGGWLYIQYKRKTDSTYDQ